MFYVIRVDEYQAICQALSMGRGQLGKLHDGTQHVALAVDDDDRAATGTKLVKVAQDKMLKQLGFAVARSADYVRVLEARLERNGEGQRKREEIRERRTVEVGS